MVSSYYPVFSSKNLEEQVSTWSKNFQLTVEHHFEAPFMEFYVLKDANGNHVSVMNHEKIEREGLFGMRVNVDDYDAMVDSLKEQGYAYLAGPFDLPSTKVGILDHPDNPNLVRYIVMHHKKG